MFRKLLVTILAALSFSAFAAVDVNQASQADLETVKGIGPGLSTKIIDARKKGAFKNWDDFQERVSGVGPGNSAKFSAAGLTVGGSAFSAAAAPTDKTAKAPMAEKTEKKPVKTTP